MNIISISNLLVIYLFKGFNPGVNISTNQEQVGIILIMGNRQGCRIYYNPNYVGESAWMRLNETCDQIALPISEL